MRERERGWGTVVDDDRLQYAGRSLYTRETKAEDQKVQERTVRAAQSRRHQGDWTVPGVPAAHLGESVACCLCFKSSYVSFLQQV